MTGQSQLASIYMGHTFENPAILHWDSVCLHEGGPPHAPRLPCQSFCVGLHTDRVSISRKWLAVCCLLFLQAKSIETAEEANNLLCLSTAFDVCEKRASSLCSTAQYSDRGLEGMRHAKPKRQKPSSHANPPLRTVFTHHSCCWQASLSGGSAQTGYDTGGMRLFFEPAWSDD